MSARQRTLIEQARNDKGVDHVLPSPDLLPLGIAPGMKLRWLDSLHQLYLALHRARLLQ